ncbi:MAG TPA: threonine--tRNA ligase [Herpetosiphon sp.]|uniref:Threonine--tRNA ligase n=1 Tax=Herpetosiphon aurantiacus (strain ATCC 23779 / DSM 785 / 114-95) TaxID=316274 RepID=A9B2N7_HERA2|nr:threonine--tRNA ligase [Herpetosiphon sp.]ABX05488.1 threonyl-tRNA synthetase [Herpetosiphon aurantiacus DSM 785]HBW52870.1 threonine--tRNA ligase [Herpetosiphon sp.]
MPPVNPDNDPLYRLRHSTAHVLAQAVLEIFPEGKIAIGPPVENGFYYDFDLPRPLTPDDLKDIEAKMRKIIKAKHRFAYREVSADEARELFKNQPYKLELIAGLAKGEDEYGEKAAASDTIISTYKHDSFEDLCKGPHVESLGDIPPNGFKLLRVSGAYWRGDEKRPMLQRIYGTVWPSKEELDHYLWQQEEAKKRDHRKLGRELGLFTFSQKVGAGLALWLPKGAILRDVLERFLRQAQIERGYLPVVTPHMGKIDLYKTSGHWYTYRDGIFPPMREIENDDTENPEGEIYLLKPMNCPHHIEIYASEPRSYRDLPLRLAEFGTVYRYEHSGELTGLLRVRSFTVDDSHLFVTPDQLEAEFLKVVDLILFVFGTMGLKDFQARVGLREVGNPKYIGSDEVWEKAQNAIINAAEKKGLNYIVVEGEAAFYGPKLDFIFRDVLGRQWQLGTVQVDYNLPERFEIEYTGEDGQKHRPIMIHRAPFGSIERFVGTLIEQYAGAFPVWLAPVQVTLVPITDRHVAYAESVAAKLNAQGLRVEVDASNNRMNAKIRDAQKLKIPYMLVVGDKEEEAGAVAVRQRSGGDLGSISVDEFIARIKDEVANYQ